MTPVFIGGSGRSGTSVLKQVLSAHPSIVSIPGEIRVIVDPGGALDLLSALTENWSPYAADYAIRHFRNLLEASVSETVIIKAARKILSAFGFSPARYSHCVIGKDFGESYYRQRLQTVIDQLVCSHTKGHWIGTPSYQWHPVIEETVLLAQEKTATIIASFFHDLYRNLEGSSRATHWVDDTPFNILHAKKLLNLFPEMRLVHIYRHPLDVVASYKSKTWGGTNAEVIAIRVSNILNKWLEEKKLLPAGTYTEIRMESLLEDPKGHMADLCRFIGIEEDESLRVTAETLTLKEAHLSRWQSDLSTQEATLCRKHLHQHMVACGYS